MNRIYSRAAALLALCLCLTLACPALAAGQKNPLPVDTSALPVPIDEGLSYNLAFEYGNKSYLKGDYLKAESYYLLTIRKMTKMARYTYGDVGNNLALTYLQLEKNEEAYALCRCLLTENLAASAKEKYGYMLNYLVCAHACGISAAKALKEALDEGFFSFDDLSQDAQKDPGEYAKLFTGMLYNVVYMDMEGDVPGGAASYAYYPSDRLSDLDSADLMEDLAARAGKGEDGQAIAEDMSKAEYLGFLQDVLEQANEWNRETFGQADPDIEALLVYLDALKDQAE